MNKTDKKYGAAIPNDSHAELERLKTQLNPHFLFNTLTSIYALIELDREQARESVYRLTHLLRYVVYDIPQPTLGGDLQFTENYISLMKLRLSSDKKLNVNIDAGDYSDYEIAPMLFATVVENAFKHSRHVQSAEPITITILARDGYIDCFTSNPYNPAILPASPHGVGLVNLRRRLHLLYGDDATLTVGGDGSVYKCQLKIRLTK